jgi:hypothetical protein
MPGASWVHWLRVRVRAPTAGAESVIPVSGLPIGWPLAVSQSWMPSLVPVARMVPSG